MSTIMPGLTGWLIYHHDALDEIVVTDDAGTTLASRPLPPDAPGTAAWDRALFNLGYARSGDWRPAEGGYRANVHPL